MKFIVQAVTLLTLLTGCSDQPRHLSGKTETIEVSYVNWACDCADFIETKYFKNNPAYETNEHDCIFIEPANPGLKIPDSFYEKAHFEYYLNLTGQFYNDKGIPESYDRKTEEEPDKARVFRYETFQLISKNKSE